MKELLPWITLILLGVYHGLNPGMGWLFAVALGLQERSRSAVLRAFVPIALGHAASIAAVVALVAAMQSVISPTLLKGIGAGTLIAFGCYKLAVPMSCPRWVGMRVGFRQLTAWSFLMATACGAGLMVVPVLLKLPSASQPAAHIESNVAVKTTFQASSNTPLACHHEAGDNKTTLHPVRFSSPTGKESAEESHSAVPTSTSETPACHRQVEQMAARGGAGLVTAGAAVVLHTLAMFLVMGAIALLVYEKVGLAILRRAWFNLDLLWAGALIGAGILTLLL